MPYLVVKRKNKYRLYKEGPDGHPVGRALGTHDTLASARKQQRALYAAERRAATEQAVQVDENRFMVVLEQNGGENSGYVYLGVNWVWEIDRLQSALNTIFGYDEGWRWNDPYTYHCTLAYAEDVTDEQLMESSKAIVGKNALDLKVESVGRFDREEDQVIYLKIEKTDELKTLQQAIYDSLNAQGVALSEFSNPENWTPHITLAYAPKESVVPEVSNNMIVQCNRVCIGRGDYDVLGEYPLKWKMPEHYGEDGMGPMTEQAVASWKVGVGRDLTVGKDIEWDGSAAAASVFKAAGFDGDSPDTALARKAFLIYNAAAPKLKGSYKLPIAQWSNGKLVVVPAGLRNAASRLPQVKGVPQDVIDRAGRALNSYKRKAGIGEQMESPKKPIRMTFISEMRGNFPQIALPNDVNIEALKQIVGEGNLDFVTLPIGEVGAESRNGRSYPRTPIEELVQQVNELRPEGMWGHLTDEEMATRYDPPAVRWLAAQIDNRGIAWGKFLPLTVEAREYYRLARATNARVGTSLTALAEMLGDEVQHLELITIDIADPRRVGISATAALPHLTQEMNGKIEDAVLESPTHDVIVRVRESSPVVVNEELKMLTEEQINELISERDALKTRVTELETTSKELAEKEKLYSETIGELLEEAILSEVREQVKLSEAHDLVVEYVKAMQPKNRHGVKEAVTKVLEKESIKKLLKNTIREQMGPVQPRPIQPRGKDETPEQRWLEVPQGVELRKGVH